MTWTCQRCGKNHGDRKVEEELTTLGRSVDYEELRRQDPREAENTPMKTTRGWQCDRCEEFHPTPERPPGEYVSPGERRND